MSTTKLFVTGMFRSGTTLLARMLNAHPLITLASDPYAPLFKSFRDENTPGLFDYSFDYQSPLQDYYFDEQESLLFKKIQGTSFDIPLNIHNREDVIEKIKKHAAPYSPKILPYIDDLSGKKYAGLLNSGLDIIQKAYGKNENTLIGIKEVWTTEFTPHFLDLFDQSKAILIVRDPRAVAASNFASQTHRYPFFFLARQWRKLSALTSHYSDNENVLVLRFEDLITQPMEMVEKICHFLNIYVDEQLTDPKTFKDGSGSQWRQNSSYNDKKNDFNQNVLDKWKKILTEEQIGFIEALCLPEMRLFDYKIDLIKNANHFERYIDQFNEIEEGIANWIKPYSIENVENEKFLEKKRFYFLEDNQKHNKKDIIKNYLSDSVFLKAEQINLF